MAFFLKNLLNLGTTKLNENCFGLLEILRELTFHEY